jgi:SAM-dependent methyltransferase
MVYVVNRLKHELRRLRHWYRYRGSDEFKLDLPPAEVRRILKRCDLGFYPDGNPSWWYATLDINRNEEDELTKAALRYIVANVPRDARILGTGCGTGWMLFWLARRGFSRIEGFDYLPNVAKAAQEIAALAKIDAKIWADDGFRPKLEGSYDLIIALHWLYSAWQGNYGNAPRKDQDRDRLLTEFLSVYKPHLAPGGLLMVELIDAISDYTVPPVAIYQVRHSVTQVDRCAAAVGMSVVERMANVKYGYLPRMVYVLRRQAPSSG